VRQNTVICVIEQEGAANQALATFLTPPHTCVGRLGEALLSQPSNPIRQSPCNRHNNFTTNNN
jgi:hypothetical protein